jgi:hypothetical protein
LEVAHTLKEDTMSDGALGVLSILVLLNIFCALGGIIAGMWKGRAAEEFFLGLLLGPIGLLIGAFLPKVEPTQICPECRAKIPADARRCMHCRTVLVDDGEDEIPRRRRRERDR